MTDHPAQTGRLQRFRRAYAEHRRREGHDDHTPLHEYPYHRQGPLRKMWAVRARSFEVFIHSVIEPFEASAGSTITTLDLGAGNGWLSYRMARRGHNAIAVDIRSDTVDGLGTVGRQPEIAGIFKRIAAEFAELPFGRDSADICIFNASFHYATSATDVLGEAVRITRPGGRIVIVDTPFYRTRADGERMVSEKRCNADTTFGELAEDLTAIPFIEFLTADRLAAASTPLGLTWTRHRVRYPLWYELRPLVARMKGKRPPSRFDVWEGTPS